MPVSIIEEDKMYVQFKNDLLYVCKFNIKEKSIIIIFWKINCTKKYFKLIFCKNSCKNVSKWYISKIVYVLTCFKIISVILKKFNIPKKAFLDNV